LDKFLRQGVDEGFTAAQSWASLAKILAAPAVVEKSAPVKNKSTP
jgi:hypothetical protein